MNTLDNLLTDAAHRLDEVAAGVAVPPAPRPSLPVGRLAAAALCVLAVIGGVVAIRVRDRHPQRPVSYPPGLLDGANGPEITLTEVPDGDADPATWKLQATPDGGTVTRTAGEAATASTLAAVPATAVGGTAPPQTDPGPPGTGDTMPAGQASGTIACLTLDQGSGYCPGANDPPQLFLGNRSTTGQAIVSGLPSTTFAVTFQSGGVRFWERPLHGVALFPYTEQAGTTVTFAAIDAGGAQVAGASQMNEMMTDAEVAAAVVTTTTGDSLTAGWFVDVADGVPGAGAVERLTGRTVPLGFRGPFTDQAYIATPYSAGRWVDVLTVRTVDVAAIEQRLATVAGSSVRWSREVYAGVTVLLFADDGVPAGEIDSAVATLHEGGPGPSVTDLGRPFAYATPSGSSLRPDRPVLTALVADVVAHLSDGRAVFGSSDDVGDVQLMIRVESNGWMGIDVGPHAATSRLPVVGEVLAQSISIVPADVSGIRVTLDDGTIVTPDVIDVTGVVDGKLVDFTTDHDAHTITAVDVQHG